MDAKIASTFWSDPELDAAPQEFITVLTWIKTNPDRNDCGAYRFSPSRFTFQTKLEPAWHDRVRQALPARFAQDGHWFLYIPFIRECLQLGEIVGKNGGVNNGAKALLKPFKALPKPFQGVLESAYHDLSVIWTMAGPARSPSQALPPFSDNGLDSQDSASAEGLTKPLVSPLRRSKHREEKRREEQSTEPVIPTEAEVVAHGQGPAGIPAEFCRYFHNKKCINKSWVKKTAHGDDICDWPRELLTWWVKDRATWRPPTASAAAGTVAGQSIAAETADLRKRLATATGEEKAVIRRRLNELEYQ